MRGGHGSGQRRLGTPCGLFPGFAGDPRLSAIGYGIHYEFGLFKQEFVNGHQWSIRTTGSMFGDPWEIFRPEYTIRVQLYGDSRARIRRIAGTPGHRWVNTRTILGCALDTPIAGYGTPTVNSYGLWASKATEEFDLATFNRGGYVEAVGEKVVERRSPRSSTRMTRPTTGRNCAWSSSIFHRLFAARHHPASSQARGELLDNFPDKVAIHLNDTHPAVAIVELLRILVDEEELPVEPGLVHRDAHLRLHQTTR